MTKMAKLTEQQIQEKIDALKAKKKEVAKENRAKKKKALEKERAEREKQMQKNNYVIAELVRLLHAEKDDVEIANMYSREILKRFPEKKSLVDELANK